MNIRGKIGRVSTALTLVVEAVGDLEAADEPELQAAAQALSNQLRDRYKELKDAHPSP